MQSMEQIEVHFHNIINIDTTLLTTSRKPDIIRKRNVAPHFHINIQET